MLVGESRVPVALPAALLLWIPLQQSLLVRLGHYAHGHSQTAENVLLFRTTLAIVIISSFFSAGGAPSATKRRIAIIVQSLWPVLYLSEYRYSASIAVALSGGFLIKNGITSDSSVQLRMALLALVSVFFAPLGSILASAHSELGTCMAHACCCILFFVLAAAMWRDRASSIAADVIIFASTLMAVLALFPLCSLGPISSGAFPFARPTLCELSQCAPFSALDRRESPASGWLSVVVPDDEPEMRYLRAGSTILGHVNTVTGLSVMPVTYAAAAFRFLRRPTPPQHPDAEPKPQIALVVGFGAGDVTNVLQNTRDATNAPAWHVDVLEVDHVATWMAATYLGAHVADGGRVISRDPAAYLRGLSQEEKESGAAADAGEDAEAPAAVYDAVIINAVRPSGAIDTRFSEDDVLKGIRRTLKIGGVAAIRLFGTALTARPEVAALMRHFRHVELYGESPGDDGRTPQDTIVYASDAPLVWQGSDIGAGSGIAIGDMESRRIRRTVMREGVRRIEEEEEEDEDEVELRAYGDHWDASIMIAKENERRLGLAFWAYF